jgi:uncharacterized membrane protein
MDLNFKGLLVGGLLPALLFGAAGLLQKVYGRTEAGNGPYLLLIGVGVLLCGGIYAAFSTDRTLTPVASLAAVMIGAFWALGMLCVLLGLLRYGAPLAQLAPLYNMNTLVVTLLALVIFAENRDVNVVRLLSGTMLIVVGGVLVARA